MSRSGLDFIVPDWPAPPKVRAACTTRQGGVSLAPYKAFNLATHVGDAPDHVVQNRRDLSTALRLPAEPRWLQQVHGNHVVRLESGMTAGVCEGDASMTAQAGEVSVVLTADCLPVLFCNRAGDRAAAAHAGWRGLAGGVLEATVASMKTSPDEIMAWLGPAIGPQAFEVGPEVREVFLQNTPGAETAFQAGAGDRWLADLYTLARLRLQAVGVASVYGGGMCTYSEPARFYSFRREAVTGRMASLIWIE